MPISAQFRIPTILGITIVVGGLVAAIAVTQTMQTITSRAAPEKRPKTIKVTNRTHDRATISWTTEVPTTGYIQFGQGRETNQVASDDRVKPDKPSTIHHITISRLQPDTTFTYRILSDGDVIDGDGKPFSVTTAPLLSSNPPSLGVLRGRVQTHTAEGIEALVYVTIDTTTLSTQTNVDGRFLMPLTEQRTGDGSSYLSYPPESGVLELFVEAGAFGNTRTTYPITDALQKDLPTITLGPPGRASADE